jgi:hypothetical protein
VPRSAFNGKGSIGFSAHGFRATASTILNEMGYRSDVIERQLAYAERDKVRASYNHAEYMDAPDVLCSSTGHIRSTTEMTAVLPFVDGPSDAVSYGLSRRVEKARRSGLFSICDSGGRGGMEIASRRLQG